MTALWLIVLAGVLSIVYAAWATSSVLGADAGNARMQEIAAAVREGAQAYLKRQYMTIGLVGIVIFALLAYFLGILVAVGFLIGAVLSGAAGFIAAEQVARATDDATFLLGTTAMMAVTPYLRKAPYAPSDFVPVGRVATITVPRRPVTFTRAPSRRSARVVPSSSTSAPTTIISNTASAAPRGQFWA